MYRSGLKSVLVISAAVISMSFSAHAAIDNVDLKPGVINQVECQGKTGKGFVSVQRLDGSTLVSHWYKVKSMKLCGKTQSGQNPLSDIALDNFVNNAKVLSKPIFDGDGFLVDIENAGKSVFGHATNHVAVGQEAAFNWLYPQQQMQ